MAGNNVSRGVRAEASEISGIYVISIGVNKMAPEMNMVQKFAVADAVSIGDSFEKRVSVGDQRITQGTKPYLSGKDLLPGRAKIEKHVLKDAEVTRESIAAAFESIAQRIEPQDIFVFNVAGLGHKVGDQFVFFTSTAKSPTDSSGVITISEIQALFRKIRAKNKVIIIDSCDSSAGYETAASAFIEADSELRTALDSNILFIGSDGVAYEDSKFGHGFITKVILDGIEGEADFDKNGVVSARELEAYMYCGAMKYSSEQRKVAPRVIRSGKDFNLGFTDKADVKIAEQKVLAAKSAPKGPNESEPVRAKLSGTPTIEDAAKLRDGDDYALLFANDKYDNPEWETLKNPRNDVNDIAKELRETYRFKEVVIKENLTTKEIRDTLVEYQSRKFSRPDDQLFVFFAGHGVTDKVSPLASNSYYVGRSSPPFTIEDSGHFLLLESILQMVAAFQISHVMTVFDTCYAGQVWKPSVATLRTNASMETPDNSFRFGRGIGKSDLSSALLNNSFDDRLIFAKRTMNNLSRIVLTSGKRPVLDAFRKPDGTLSRNSPFADKFLEALRTGGRNYGVLPANEIFTYVMGLPVQPIMGPMGGSDGDFVFVRPEKNSDVEKGR
jgi:uncharacterized caspase-like protein